jgi:FMN reductase
MAVELCEATFAATGMIWSSPLYHGTVSGAFKNALDWLDLLSDRDPPFLTDKVIGFISAAGGVQALQAVNTMEFVVRALRGMAVPLVAPVTRAYRAFDESGQVADGASNDNCAPWPGGGPTLHRTTLAPDLRLRRPRGVIYEPLSKNSPISR